MGEALDPAFLEIVQGCIRRDRNQQNTLYRLYYSYGMSICLRYATDREQAVALLNEAFLKVFLNLKKYNVEMPFKPWFRKIVVNTCINYVKRQKKLNMEVGMEEVNEVETPETILSWLNYQELMTMVQSLSLAYRTVFNMYVIDGFKHEEIADHLGISVSTSKSNLARARAKLQELVTRKLQERYA